ncbi:MAG: hypothetical protein HRT90_11835 [Candidatus Margulisbacteria bacterium]|nr:hypothetical protein [Candidatus Margulisiibacteriota bacterium]
MRGIGSDSPITKYGQLLDDIIAKFNISKEILDLYIPKNSIQHDAYMARYDKALKLLQSDTNIINKCTAYFELIAFILAAHKEFNPGLILNRFTTTYKKDLHDRNKFKITIKSGDIYLRFNGLLSGPKLFGTDLTLARVVKLCISKLSRNSLTLGIYVLGDDSTPCFSGYIEKSDTDGSNYKGYVKSDVRNGKGEMTYPDGSVYDGEWKAGKQHGRGIYTCSGSVYDGEWKDGEQNGRGVLTKPNETVQDGKWRKWEFLGSTEGS